MRRTKRAAARDDRHLVDAIGSGQKPRGDRVPSFVIGRFFLLFFREDFFTLGAHEDFVAGMFEVGHVDLALVVARGPERRFVDDVANVGTG